MNKRTETDLLTAGLHKLGTVAQVKIVRKRMRPSGQTMSADAIINLQVPSGDTVDVCVQVKRTMRPAHLAEIEYVREQCQAQMPDAEFLLISSVVSEPLAQELRNRKIWFIDMAGNVYVDLSSQLLLFVAGLKPERQRTRPAVKRISEQAARVLFHFLRHGPEVQATYRDLVQATGVSLGMISKLAINWRDEGLIRRAGRGAHMVLQPAKVLDLWCDAYAEQLAPKLLIGRYRSAHDTDFAALLQSTKPLPVVIGGEVAADMLTGYVRAGGLHLYMNDAEAVAIRQELGLAPSESGNVELRRTFSSDLAGEGTAHGMPLAHPVLVYAELMADGDDRLSETAMRLRQEHLQWTL